MGYQIKPYSKRAANIFVPRIKNKEPLPSRIGKEFPFGMLKPGESFYIVFSETIPYDRKLAIERTSRYNRSYNCYFVTLKHEDEPKRLEVARIV